MNKPEHYIIDDLKWIEIGKVKQAETINGQYFRLYEGKDGWYLNIYNSKSITFSVYNDKPNSLNDAIIQANKVHKEFLLDSFLTKVNT